GCGTGSAARRYEPGRWTQSSFLHACAGVCGGIDEVGVGMAKDLMAIAGTEGVKQPMTQFK
ncbi:MAG: hypothetical protein ABL995_18715, partial [Bryobacteraceae bacterium]